jgi:hypothetical protein
VKGGEVCLLILAAVLFVAGSAMAGKCLDVMVTINFYPSGPHYNLNIHGKDINKASAAHRNKCRDTELNH